MPILQQACDSLADHAARGEPLTGANVRAADQAVSDAEGTVKLLEAALPKAATAAYAAERVRSRIENGAARAPFQDALAAAETALQVAQSARDAVLDGHGRDFAAQHAVAELRRVQRVNDSRKRRNQPLVAWP